MDAQVTAAQKSLARILRALNSHSIVIRVTPHLSSEE